MHAFDQVVALASKQHGVISRRQLTDFGIPSTSILRALEKGQLVYIYSGVYRLAGTPVSRDARLWAAIHFAGGRAVISHRTAGWHWRLEGLGKTPPNIIDVSIPVARRVFKRADVRVYRTRSLVLAKDYATLHGIPCTSLARTLVDLSGVLSAKDLEHAFDSAVRRNEENRKSVIEATFRLGQGRPETAALMKIAERLDHGCTQSWLENEVRQVLREEGIPTPLPQLALQDNLGKQIGIFDFAWPERSLVLMVDSWEFHKPRDIFEKDRRQTDQLSSIGWHPFPVTYRRLMHDRAALMYELRGALGLLGG